MPRKFMFTKEEIIASAFEIVREGGFSALTARSLAEKLGCSAKPIFGLFKSMDELSSEVKKMAEAYYEVSWKNAFDTGFRSAVQGERNGLYPFRGRGKGAF